MTADPVGDGPGADLPPSVRVRRLWAVADASWWIFFVVAVIGRKLPWVGDQDLAWGGLTPGSPGLPRRYADYGELVPAGEPPTLPLALVALVITVIAGLAAADLTAGWGRRVWLGPLGTLLGWLVMVTLVPGAVGGMTMHGFPAIGILLGAVLVREAGRALSRRRPGSSPGGGATVLRALSASGWWVFVVTVLASKQALWPGETTEPWFLCGPDGVDLTGTTQSKVYLTTLDLYSGDVDRVLKVEFVALAIAALAAIAVAFSLRRVGKLVWVPAVGLVLGWLSLSSIFRSGYWEQVPSDSVAIAVVLLALAVRGGLIRFAERGVSRARTHIPGTE